MHVRKGGKSVMQHRFQTARGGHAIQGLAWLGLLALLALLSACAGSKIVHDSPILEPKPDQPYSTIYFMRKDDKVYRGLAEDAVWIEINGQNVVKLAKGEYAMIRIKPIESTVRVISMSYIGTNPYPQEVFGEDTFNFAANQTNFIDISLRDGEFRGIYFMPVRVESKDARAIARDLKPVGVSKEQRIENL